MWDVVDACFRKGRESFEIIHQNGNDMRVLEASFLSFVWKRVILLKHNDLPCLSFVTFPQSIYVGCAGCMLQQGERGLGNNSPEYGMSG